MIFAILYYYLESFINNSLNCTFFIPLPSIIDSSSETSLHCFSVSKSETKLISKCSLKKFTNSIILKSVSQESIESFGKKSLIFLLILVVVAYKITIYNNRNDDYIIREYHYCKNIDKEKHK